MKKTEEMRKIKHDNNLEPNEELQFILWKAELNKDLKSFWEYMTE